MIEKLLPAIEKVQKLQNEKLQSNVQFNTKDDKLDFVSNVDTQSQEELITAVENEFPQAGIISEEEGGDKHPQDGSVWFVIDPLDGSANYKANLGLWAISIGIIVDGKIEEGALSLPFSGQVLSSKEVTPPDNAPQNLKDVKFYGIDGAFENVPLQGTKAKRRQLGAAVPTLFYCCLNAFEGRNSLDFALMGGSSLWDIAGAAACLKEMGGALIDHYGRDFTQEADIFNLLGGPEEIKSKKNITYVASSSRTLATQIYQSGYLQLSSKL